MTRAALRPRGEALLQWVFPRRCPFCDAVLPADAPDAAFCPACAAEEKRLRHEPPRLAEGEHVLSAVSGAAAAYYYADGVRTAILRCKRGARPWYARELADRMAVCLWGAAPAAAPGRRPEAQSPAGLPFYSAVVPVPPRTAGAYSLPGLLAARLGAVLGLPVRRVLYPTRELRPQKTLDFAERQRNVRGAYAVRGGTDLGSLRLLLVDDIITTGATVSACAAALQAAGAAEVFAACIAANEELPKEKQKKNEPQEPTQKGNVNETTGHRH